MLASDDMDGARVLEVAFSFFSGRLLPKRDVRRVLFFARALPDAAVPMLLDVDATAVLTASILVGTLACLDFAGCGRAAGALGPKSLA